MTAEPAHEKEKVAGPVAHRFCVAPMLDRSDRHARYFWRLLTRRAILYTEMVTTGALIHAEPARFLAFDACEQPLALQLGGSEPDAMAHCARLAEAWGYAEININVGCPSDRVQSGRFGACLMAEPERVAACVAAMQAAVSIPVTVKTRIGIDDRDSEAELYTFIRTVQAACRTFIVHARKAWLQGLSPRENREIPPLDYPRVYRLKAAFPELEIILNGGIANLAAARAHLQQVDGVMLGRAAYEHPSLLASVDQDIFNEPGPPAPPAAIVMEYLPYIERQLAQGVPLTHLTRPLIGLFHNRPGAKQWRRILSEQAPRPGADTQVVLDALAQITDRIPTTQESL